MGRHICRSLDAPTSNAFTHASLSKPNTFTGLVHLTVLGQDVALFC